MARFCVFCFFFYFFCFCFQKQMQLLVRSYVVSGDFDYILTKPVSALFRSLFGGSDILDLSIIFLSIGFILFSAGKIESISLFGATLYTVLVFNAFLIALAFHILVLSIGVLTTEVDNTIMLYRDITQMGRVPVDIYLEPLRSFLTFAIPVGIMMTFPAKALMGLLSAQIALVSLGIGLLFFLASLWFWRFSLRHYSSASS
ncbi:MAG: ABC-2 family transporter protein [Candidatus Levybacteria bacterium]|nr:ABC-2 family transporter protein [Candidatus Levybacteria bacterium]